jgi:FkbM family methyltransferase
MHGPFLRDLDAALEGCVTRFHADGLASLYPYARSPDVIAEASRGALARALRKVAAWAGVSSMGAAERRRRDDLLAAVRTHAVGLDARLNATYALLADGYSRRTLVEVMSFFVLGPSHVRLSRNDDTYQRHLDAVPGFATGHHTAAIGMLDGWLNRYDLDPLGVPIAADLHPLSILYTFQLEQYRYARGDVVVEAEPGDVAIDGGACWGDTALYLAHRVGSAGRVHAFEFAAENLAILERNLAANPELACRIAVERHALWGSSGVELSFDASGPATRLTRSGGGTERATTLAIDDLVRRAGLPRVDFIKLDVEGAELEALHGAEAAIRRFRPKIAVAVYHRLEDFVTIPRFLADLGLGYRFYLDHFSVKWEETILFATPEPSLG